MSEQVLADVVLIALIGALLVIGSARLMKWVCKKKGWEL